MSDFITLNGRRIPAADADFNFIVALEENNVPITEIQRKPLSTAKAYVAYSAGIDPENAGRLINEHVVNGGDMTDIMEMIGKKVEESGFFRALQERTTENLETSEGSEEKVTKMPRKRTSDPQD